MRKAAASWTSEEFGNGQLIRYFKVEKLGARVCVVAKKEGPFEMQVKKHVKKGKGREHRPATKDLIAGRGYV